MSIDYLRAEMICFRTHEKMPVGACLTKHTRLICGSCDQAINIKAKYFRIKQEMEDRKEEKKARQKMLAEDRIASVRWAKKGITPLCMTGKTRGKV